MSVSFSDFRNDANAATLTFVSDLDVADTNAAWMKYKHPSHEIAVIQLAIPESKLKELSIGELWHDGEGHESSKLWSQVVHAARGWGYARLSPEEKQTVDEVLEKDVLVGHLAYEYRVKLITAHEFWEDINNEDFVAELIDADSGRIWKPVQ